MATWEGITFPGNKSNKHRWAFGEDVMKEIRTSDEWVEQIAYKIIPTPKVCDSEK